MIIIRETGSKILLLYRGKSLAVNLQIILIILTLFIAEFRFINNYSCANHISNSRLIN